MSIRSTPAEKNLSVVSEFADADISALLIVSNFDVSIRSTPAEKNLSVVSDTVAGMILSGVRAPRRRTSPPERNGSDGISPLLIASAVGTLMPSTAGVPVPLSEPAQVGITPLLIASRVDSPIRPTAEARTTYSPSDNIAGMSSEMPVPLPRTNPPAEKPVLATPPMGGNGATIPPSRKRGSSTPSESPGRRPVSLIESSVATPMSSTDAARMTYSPSDNIAGMLSEVAVPGPEMYPPSARP